MGAAALRTTKKRDFKLDVNEITRVADEAAKATKLMVRAMFIQNGIEDELRFPTRLFAGSKKPPGWT